MKHGTRVRFIEDIPTWNGKSRKAKKGDQGTVFGEADMQGRVTVSRDRKAKMNYNVDVNFLEVIQ